MTDAAPSAAQPAALALLRRAAAALRGAGAAAGRHALDAIWPPSCPACHASVQQNGFLCAQCWARTPFIERPFCERSGAPFPQDWGEGMLSPEVMAEPPVWNRARAVTRYDEGPARRLVQRLKYADRVENAGPMGLWMARAGAELLRDADLIVPTPLHRRRLFSRRFNQAAALAASVSRASGVPFDPLALERVKPTPPQVGLSRAQRADNVQGAFRTPQEARPRIAGRKLVLVDDVLTSGATSNAAARALLRAGAARVDLLVFARVVTGG
ncbi:MAG: Phosphoribosyltransferase [Hyphomicrobiales bacterium]|nr:Phosphoribosyltransferase [Hyphomicrobiales bacterium]